MSSDTPSWWSDPLKGDPDLSVTLEVPPQLQQAQQAKTDSAVAVSVMEASLGVAGDTQNRDAAKHAASPAKASPMRGRLSNVSKPGTEVSFGIWQGSANTQPTEAGAAPGGQPSCLPDASFGEWGAKSQNPGTVARSRADTASKAADVSLQGWAQQGEPGAAASPTAAGADAPGGSKLEDVSFDGWGDKAKTPGTAATGKTRGSNRVSFAVGVAEAADTPVLAAAAAGSGTPWSVAGSCSVSGQTPGSTLSTGVASGADMAQCSVRGAPGARGVRKPRSSVPAPPSGATTMQQGPEPSFNVSVDCGRFAPLMGAPSMLNMTPGGASTPGVTGRAATAEFSFPDMSQMTVGRLAGAIAKAASAVQASPAAAAAAAAASSRTPTGPPLHLQL
ncbi:hypothetical protein OEZ86_014235 [Tetradesmus obliquus]|nr:hypothetical protein OEZ86_014235 [Tetradesmus obliquus]